LACNVVIEKNKAVSPPYLGILKREAERVSRSVSKDRPVVQFHWGGGTPTYLTPPQIEDLFGFTRDHFHFAPDAEIGIEIDFKVVELETLYTHWRKGAADEMNAGITSNNIAYVTSDPLYAIVRFFHSGQIAPVGVNWGGYKNPKVDALIDEAKQTFDVAKQDELLAQAHAMIVDDATLVWVVHDTNPHALSPKVKKFVQAQHWFQDLTQIGLE
jgi:hypothetical protein